MGSQHKRKLSVDDSIVQSTKDKKINSDQSTPISPLKEQTPTVVHNEQEVDVKQKKNTTPIHRGKFKSRWLSKHSSLLKRSRNAQGLLISCVVGSETRALGQAQQFLLEYIAKLFPNRQSTWERLEDDLDVDESFIDESNSGDEQAKKEKGGDEEGKKDKMLEAVDSGCSGLLFLRFRVDVTPTHFIRKLIEHLLSLSSEDREKVISKTSYCSRWIPVDYICNSFEEDISKTFEQVKSDYFVNEGTLHSKIAIVSEIRNNERLKRQDIIKCIAPSLPPTLTVDLKSPDIVIFVSIFKSVCSMSILPKYYELKKYNIPSICK
ncbi:hypothetical protein K450DRAFT_222607 [Umbelopsis ramanniana AG]|uniref:THUMP domain-containing protein n=1 Tax=Umbelopsis ramanniana AG TaxID=1314678 RepID=A0AAD5EIM4_UMBRA|nr:uncharacterized protein K450DRAFT_222607 [Umbelopsis ramanniana AG]KAI8583745.1 hypothetical protein K450DRAFT_222607 [Umbelopsis ramanniana AG]